MAYNKGKPNIKNRKYKDPTEVTFNNLVNRYKQQAKHRNRSWNISTKKLIEMLQSDCHYCGSPPMNTHNVYVAKTGRYAVNNKEWADRAWVRFNGIDRQNNKLGYSVKNCVPCCKICNYAKRTSTIEEFENWINNLITFRS